MEGLPLDLEQYEASRVGDQSLHDPHAAEEEDEGVLHRWESLARIRIDNGPVRSNHPNLWLT